MGSYDSIYQEEYKRYGEAHERLANWDPNDFDRYELTPVEQTATILQLSTVWRRAGDRTIFDKKLQPVDMDPKKVTEVEKQDKTVLQNYGRPYREGRPSGTYYKFAK